MGSFVNQTTDLTQPKLAQENQELNLSSSDLDLKGPLSLRAIYSDELGYMLSGQYAQMLGSKNALSLLLETGKKAHRVNATLGYILSLHQRLKLTGEYLTEQKSFEFYSGKEAKWIGQYAYGLGYQYLFSKGLLNDINITTYYSKAQNKTLSAKEYIDEGLRYRDYRHIAGGADRSISLGLDVHPFKNTLLGLEANYDNVSYDTLYEHGQDERGLGATLSLHQLLSKKVKLELLASDRKPYQSYGVGVHWLLKSNPGSKLELGLEGKRIIGANSLSNDSQLDIDIGYEWGGVGLGHPSSYMLSNDLCDESWQSSSLLDWVSKPAVYMDQVLAVKDEHRELLGSSVSGGGLLNQDLVTTLYVIVDKGIDIELAKYFSEPQVKGESYKLEGLPDKLSYKEGVIRGKFGKEDIGKSYRVEIAKQAPQDLVQSKVSKKAKEDKKAILLFKVINERMTPYPTANHPDNPLYFTINKDNEKAYNALWLFNDSKSLSNTLELSAEGLDKNADIKWNYYHNAKDESKSTITFSGKPLEAKTYHIKIKARNEENPPGTWSPETQDFDLIVKQQNVPHIKIYEPTPNWKVDQDVEFKIADIDAGSGETFKEVSYNKDIFKSYGLSLEERNHTSTTSEIWIVGKVTQATSEEQSATIKVTNSDDISAQKDFKLNLDKRVNPTISIHNEPTPNWRMNQDVEFKIADIDAGLGKTFKEISYDKDIFKSYGLSLEERNHTNTTSEMWIVGKVTQATREEQSATIKVINSDDASVQKDFKLNLDKSVKPTITMHQEPTPNWQVGQEIKNYTISDIDAGSGATLKNVIFNKNTFKDYGLTLKEREDKATTEDHIVINGTITKVTDKEQKASITVINSDDESVEGAFQLNIDPVNPQISIFPEPMPHWKVDQKVDHKVAEIKAGSGSLKKVDFKEDVFKAYGLDLEEKNRTGTTDEIWLVGTVTQSTDQEQSTSITVTDVDGGFIKGDFKLNLDKNIKPKIIIYPEPSLHWKVGQDVNYKIADIDAGFGETLKEVTLDRNFNDYGLNLEERNRTSTKDEVWVVGNVTKQTDKEQNVTITAKNNDDVSEHGVFSLNLDKKPDYYYLTPDSGDGVIYDPGHPSHGKAIWLDEIASSNKDIELKDGRVFHLASGQDLGPKARKDNVKFHLYRVYISNGRLGSYYTFKIDGGGKGAVAVLSERPLPEKAKFVNHPGRIACDANGNPRDCQLSYPT